MNEIEKMYKNAGVKKIELDYPDNYDPFYPEFTAEKQLELTKFLLEHGLECNTCRTGKDIKYAFYIGYEHSSGDFKEFTEALAEIINDLWQDLTDADKAQIKEILE